MEKKKLQDIKVITKESISEHPLSRARRPAPVNLPKTVPFAPSAPKQSSHNILWMLAVVCIFALFFSLSFLFEKAYVTIVPKSIPIAFDETDTFVAKKDSLDKEALSYIVMSLSGDALGSVVAKDPKSVYAYATGTILLYNNYTSKPYVFPKGTEVLASNGQTYKTNKAVSIPGFRKTSTTTSPGFIRAEVTAVFPGEAANTDKTEFTIPSLKGTKQENKIYTILRTPIAGGASGTQYSISDTDLHQAFDDAKNTLKKNLLNKARVQIPDGYLFSDTATVLTVDDLPKISYSKEQSYSFGVHGKLTAYLLKKDPLVRTVVNKFINNYGGEPVMIPKISALSIIPNNENIDPDNDPSFSFYLSGEAKIVWQIDMSDVKASLVDTKKSQFESNLSQVIGVQNASFVTSPFWVRSFPDNSQKIFVSVKSVE